MGWLFGFKLHLVCNVKGVLLNFVIIQGEHSRHRSFDYFMVNLFYTLFFLLLEHIFIAFFRTFFLFLYLCTENELKKLFYNDVTYIYYCL